jgi:hypothetical protein
VTPARERWIAAALLAALAALLIVGLFADGLAGDEVIYIAAGHRHLLARDYAINTEQPPLAKMAAALPLAALGLREPPRTGDPWKWAFRFVEIENDPARVIGCARVPTVVFMLLLAVLLWRWARAAFGPEAGLLALALAAFHPSLLAHGHLVTTDVPGALAMLAASWTYWRWSQQPTPARGAGAAAVLAVAVATRLTSWILLPTFAVLEVLTIVALPAVDRRARLRALGVLVLTAAALVPFVIWAAYGFRYAPFPGESVAYPPAPELGLPGRVIALGLRFHLLPEAYLEGARYVAQHNAVGHAMYMLGRVDPVVGPRYYYLVAFVVKNTPGFLAATAIAIVAVLRGARWGRPTLAAHALLPAALTFLAASAGRIQIGERYILAVYPYLILVAAGALARLIGDRRGRIVVSLVLAAHAVPSLVQTPRGHIPYFNLLAGGTDGGHRVLADSNLDWGQDLPRLAAWMRRHGVGEVKLAYHGHDDPVRFGIRRKDLPGIHDYAPEPPDDPFTGTIVVSPNLLLNVFGLDGDDPYAGLRHRPPDDRAGVFFVYKIGR